MAITHRSDGAWLQIIKLVIWSCGMLTSVAAVDIHGFAFSDQCRDHSAYVCNDIPEAECCGLGGVSITSVLFLGVPYGGGAYSWSPRISDRDCGIIARAETSNGEYRHRDMGQHSGGSWSSIRSSTLSEDGVTLVAPKCRKVVEAIHMKFNATDDSWYPGDHENGTLSNRANNS